jgi:hypothetical protein
MALRYRITKTNAPGVPLDLDAYLGMCETGDLVYFRRDGVDPMHDWVSPYTHVAMLVVHPVTRVPLLAETVAEGDSGMSAGVHVTDARARLSAYSGAVFASRIQKPLNAMQVLDAVHDVKTVPYPRHVRWRVAECILRPLSHPSSATMQCSELVAYVLVRCGAYPVGGLPCTPSDLLARCVRRGTHLPVNPLSVNRRASTAERQPLSVNH